MNKERNTFNNHPTLIVEGSVLIFSEYQLLIIYCLSYKKIAIKTRF